MMGSAQHRDGWGVPPAQMQPGSRFPLQLRALITGLAGFPLQSLTREAVFNTDFEAKRTFLHYRRSPVGFFVNACNLR